jgi:RNA polymerase sigma factor (TIGR02999 family)
MESPLPKPDLDEAVTLDELMPEVYDELCRVASRQLRRERPDHTLQTAGLVHEAYLRLSKQSRSGWHNHLHFVRIAARMMRRILVDHARHHLRAKRGGGSEKLSLEHVHDWIGEQAPDLLEVDEALLRLAEADPEQAKIVELKFFGGLTNDEIAESLGLSLATVKRRWQFARAWLYNTLCTEARGGP